MLELALLTLCGALIAVQATVNAALGRSLGIALFAVVFSALQLVCTMPGLALPSGGAAPLALSRVPLWQYTGAALGAVILSGVAAGISRTGAFVGMVALLVGQMSTGLVIDHYGLFGAAAQPVTVPRLLGLAFIVAGLWLTKQ